MLTARQARKISRQHRNDTHKGCHLDYGQLADCLEFIEHVRDVAAIAYGYGSVIPISNILPWLERIKQRCQCRAKAAK